MSKIKEALNTLVYLVIDYSISYEANFNNIDEYVLNKCPNL